MSRIVVGVDGSPDAARALRVAIDEARLRGATLDIVHAVPEPSLLADPVLMSPPTREESQRIGEEVIGRSLDGVDTGSVVVEHTVQVGNAALVLCRCAADADLMVVGSRGRGGFRGVLIGSVAHHVVAHAPCPVLIVVPERP